ncbi:hypothetical protein [Melaminivora jejuensis]|uniref:hypothetical protein n=1 Tax=Melaminivora jejuensis TaxID=1267217 RepID=UPI001AE057CD|nr:hypothetical protein [Melaminivora jejuensis]UHJ66711.1 hypothetical protein LVC68_12130 [Melaminivora jejuensis]
MERFLLSWVRAPSATPIKSNKKASSSGLAFLFAGWLKYVTLGPDIYGVFGLQPLRDKR